MSLILRILQNQNLISDSYSLPKASLIKNEGTFKQKVAWAILRLSEKSELGTVKNVQNIIDLELSLPEPDRSYTSSTLASLVPDYLKREDPEDATGYTYIPNKDTIKLFNELKQNNG